MRRILLSAIKILVSAALLYLALRKANFADLASRIDLVSAAWLALALALTFFQIFIGVLRWRIVSAECGAPLPLRDAMRYNVIAAFFNQTLPSSIGGDAVRLWLVSRSGAGWRAATYSIFVDRAVGLVALAIIIVASLPWSYHLIGDAYGRSALALVDFAALAGGAGFLVLGTLPWPWLKKWWATHHIHACAVIANRVIFSARNEPAVMMITMLPISIAGWGVREATMGLAFGGAGLITSEGVNVSLLYGAVSFIAGAIGGLVWIFSAEKAAKDAAPLEAAE